jgi:hypothetical protein
MIDRATHATKDISRKPYLPRAGSAANQTKLYEQRFSFGIVIGAGGCG